MSLIAGNLGVVQRLLEDLPPPDEEAATAVRARDSRLTKPPGSLGRLEHIAEWLARWQGRAVETGAVVRQARHPLITALADRPWLQLAEPLGLSIECIRPPS